MNNQALANSRRPAKPAKVIKTLFTDKSLTKKATFNAFAALLDYGARLIVVLIITPFLVAGLGSYFFGTWQILNRLIGYISPTSGRPSQALKWTLAGHQSSVDYEQKRRYVSSSVFAWVLFLPVMTVPGAILTWFVPYWLKAQTQHFWHVRIAAGFLVANLVITSLISIPQSVMVGENLGYKRMGLSTGLVLVGGGLTWLALYLNSGIAGVAAAALVTTLLTGAFFLQIVRSYVPWFGLVRPSFTEIRQFLSLSIWFLAWNLIMNLMLASDVVVLGFLVSPEMVTTYSLTKYAPETLISVVAMITFAIAPGLGGIIGSQNLEKAAKIREELMVLTWLVVTVLGSTTLLWNRAFVGLWVGAEHYCGFAVTLLIVLAVTQFVMIRNDANFIDLTLRLRAKVIVGGVSAIVSIGTAVILMSGFNLGIMGLCLGLIAGRSILSVSYPLLVGRHLGIGFCSQLKSVLKPASLTILLYLLAGNLAGIFSFDRLGGLRAWSGLALSSILTGCCIFLLSFYLGLSSNQRSGITMRLRAIVAKS